VRHHEWSSTSTFDNSIKGRSTLSPVRYREPSSTSTFDDSTIGCQPQANSFLDITNTDEDEKMATPTLAFPKPLARKKAPRGKPTWLSPITTTKKGGSHVTTSNLCQFWHVKFWTGYIVSHYSTRTSASESTQVSSDTNVPHLTCNSSIICLCKIKDIAAVFNHSGC